MIVLRSMTVAAANECDEGENERRLWLLFSLVLSLLLVTLSSFFQLSALFVSVCVRLFFVLECK